MRNFSKIVAASALLLCSSLLAGVEVVDLDLASEHREIVTDGMTAADAIIFSGAVFSREYQAVEGGVILPLAVGKNQRLHLEANIGYSDPLEEQFNIGLVHRWKVPNKDWIVGENIFLDYANSPNGNGFLGLGLGAEVLAENFEARFNYYIWDSRQPRRDCYHQSSSSSSEKLVAHDHTYQLLSSRMEHYQIFDTVEELTTEEYLRKTTETWEDVDCYEAAMRGFDVEFGIPLRIKREEYVPVPMGGKNPVIVEEVRSGQWPEKLNVWAFVGYQDFQNPFGADTSGFKGRLEWRVNSNLLLETSYHDSPWTGKGGNWYTGFRMSCALDNPDDDRGFFSRLFTPEGATTEKDRWQQRVVRDHRAHFSEREVSRSGSRVRSERRTKVSRRIIEAPRAVL